jgi:septal ring factor EnvC (AmiA/AmiB activator)
MDMLSVVNEIIKNLPPLAVTLLLITAGIVFIIGFSRHGINFLKYGFKQTALDSSLEKRFDQLEAKFDARFAQIDTRFAQIDDRLAQIDDRFAQIDTRFAQIDDRFAQIDTRFTQIDKKIAAIENNHFGHLKDFLTELTSILVDRQVLNLQDKARLDNKLRGM